MMRLATDLVERVRQIIPRYSMLAPGDKVGVAVSGGADSVVLLHILHRLVSDLAIHLTVLHVNHGLRGAESDADERFVHELARELGCRMISARAEPKPGNLEQEARNARREFFQSCRDTHALTKIALGHNLSDQAETVLFRLLRGTGTAGLAGMRPVNEDGVIRPLLFASRTEIRQWAADQGIKWREDSSNASHAFARNQLRNEVIPDLTSKFNPRLEMILAGTADIAAAEEEYWTSIIQPLFSRIFSKSERGLLLCVSDLQREHRSVQRRLIRHAISQLRGNLRAVELEHVDAMLGICASTQGHDRVVVPGIDAVRSFDTLLLTRPGELNSEPRQYRVGLDCNQKIELPFRSGCIQLSLIPSDDENCVNFKKDLQCPEEVADLDFGALAKRGSPVRLEVRNWRPGDEMHRPGHQKPEKLKSLFQQFQILLWQRRHWPVAVIDEEVVWARGFGAASAYAATKDTRRLARLSFWRVGDVTEL